MSIAPDRAHWLDELTLGSGAHRDATPGQWCLMEATAYLAGEPWSDHPACVSPVLSVYGRGLNDAWDDVQRQKLIPFIPRLLGTADDGQDEARSYLALDWLLRTYAPAWLDLAGHMAEAAALREHRRIVDMAAVRSIEPAAQAAQAARSAAESAAAWSSAESAASSAASSAARSAAGPAAGRAAGSAAESAAWSAAWLAAWRAAWSAASSALTPTVEALQASALDLLDAMIDPSAVTA